MDQLPQVCVVQVATALGITDAIQSFAIVSARFAQAAFDDEVWGQHLLARYPALASLGT